MRPKGLLSAPAGVACTALLIAGAAWAAAAATRVTIKGPDHVYGSIFSSSKSCLANRKVIVFKQKGSTQNPEVDTNENQTFSFKEGSHGGWDMGNPGFGHGKFYAEATKTKGCKAGFSKTVKFGSGFVGPAKTVTVGQLFTPADECAGSYTQLQTGVSAGNSYTVPKAGVITSWSFEDGTTPVTGLRLKVGLNTSSGNYGIVGSAKAGTQTADSVNTCKTQIPVEAGDVIGIYENGGDCVAEIGNSDTYVYAAGDLPPGTNEPFMSGDLARFPVSVRVSEDCVVPKLKGKTLRAARTALKHASCALGKVRPKGQTKGRVKRQKPAAGKTLAPGAKVDVWLG